MAQILLEPNTKLNDSLTYDITAWSLAYAYGLKTNATKENVETTLPEKKDVTDVQLSSSSYGYALPYNSFEDSKFLAALLKAGLGVRINTVPITNSGKKWKEGSLFVLKGDNLKTEDYTALLSTLAEKHQKQLYPIQTGYSQEGPDLGADELQFIKAPRVAVLQTERTSSNRYGEVWHFFEQQLNYPVLQVKEERLERILSDLDVLILPGGYYSKWSNSATEKKLMEWIRKGGKLIALSEALNLLADTEEFQLKTKKAPEQDTSDVSYSELERHAISEITTGSIFEAKLDKTHPLSFGIDRYYTLKLDADAYELLENEGNALILESEAKSIAGFIGQKVKEQQKKSLLFGEESVGRGSVVYLVDNVLFRGFWYSGKQLFSNAVFF